MQVTVTRVHFRQTPPRSQLQTIMHFEMCRDPNCSNAMLHRKAVTERDLVVKAWRDGGDANPRVREAKALCDYLKQRGFANSFAFIEFA